MNPRPTGPKPVALPNCATPRKSYIIGRGRRTRTLDTWFWRPLLYQLSYTPSYGINGGEDGIRTHAALANPNDLANRPLQPLEYFSRLNNSHNDISDIDSVAERVGFEPTVPFGITGFQDQLLKPLGHLSLNVDSTNRIYKW